MKEVLMKKGCAVSYVVGKNATLLHVCNAQGVMGAGIAKQIKQQHPSAFESYNFNHNLGSVTYGYNDCVANLVAQEFYGRKPMRYLNYGILAQCFNKVVSDLKDSVEELVIPHKMGCGLSGGDWRIVTELIKALLLPHFKITVVMQDS